MTEVAKRKIKILLTTGIYPPEIGGPATYTALLEKEMPKRGIEVEVLPFRTVRKFPKIIRHLVFFIKALLGGRDKDLLYTQDAVSVGFPTMLAAKILRKPFLIRVPGDYAWEQSTQRFGVKETIDEFQNKKYGWRVELLRKIEAATVRNANLAITPSKYFRDLVARWNPGKDNVAAIYNGIDFSQIAENKNDHEKRTIITAGRLVPWKGFDVLIEMMTELPDWKLFIAGDGPEKDKLSKLVADLGLGGRVFLLGQMGRADLFKKMQACEIFVLNTSFESFSFQIVEAMYAGLPVITTNIGNLSEIIDDGKEGILVSPNDQKAILEAVNKLQNGEFRLKITENAKRKAADFSLERTLEKTAEAIRGLLKK